MVVIYYLQPATYYLLPITYYLLPIAYYLGWHMLLLWLASLAAIAAALRLLLAAHRRSRFGHP